jgi:hypothetical protein
MRPRRRGMGGIAIPAAYYSGMEGLTPGMPFYYNPQGLRATSVPNLRAGYTPPLRGGRAKSTRVGNRPMVGLQPGMMPEYAPVTGMPGPTCPQGAGSPFAAPAQPRMPPRAPPQHKLRPPSGVEAVAKGAHYAQPSPQLPRGRSEPPVSAQLNRTQPSNKRAGPSGQEWIPSDNVFLDACTCTTNCQCRKGARVLYRQQGQGDEKQNTWGEIRYILKDDLGRDCGDHSRCRDDEDSDCGRKKGKKGKEKKADEESADVKKIRKEMKGLREDIKNMRIGRERMGPDAGMGSNAVGMGRMPSPGGWPGMKEGEIDPRMGQRMGAGDLLGIKFKPRMQQQMMGGMQGRNSEDDMSFQDAEEAMDSMMGPGMLKMPPHLKDTGMRRLKPRRGLPARPPRRAPDFDPHLEYGVRTGRRTNMNRPGRGVGRPPPPLVGYDLDEDSMGGGIHGRGRLGPMDDDEGNWSPMGGRPGKTSSEWNATHAHKYAIGTDSQINMPQPPRQSPPGRGSGSGDGRPVGAEGRRPNQAHVDDGDDY